MFRNTFYDSNSTKGYSGEKFVNSFKVFAVSGIGSSYNLGKILMQVVNSKISIKVICFKKEYIN